ncbi:MAG: TonB-dependent receptor [Bacteroidia bacterium]|nr:TonB-dependent receptor [Bacteroidia bacterium]MCZ2140269.1 TonB-dependent receptor [Bacteroidia bacterium]
MFKKIVFPFLLSFLSFSLLAQRQSGIDASKAMNRLSIGRLYGKVIDSKTKQPVDYATLTLFAMQKDSVISGALARANGDFSLEKLPMGKYRLRVSFIGYKSVIKDVVITPNALEQDLGNIAIESDAKSLSEVTVQGERAAVVMSVDRRVYSIEQDISTKGGTAEDAVKNIPGLSIDADGAVTMRNSNPTIFVDGRPTNFTLDQIPADQISRIEVITNPSAKFDASASGGILNIVMKKNNKPGYNGMVTLGAGYPERYNGMVNLNIKEGKSNFSISYNINKSTNYTKGYTERTYLRNGENIGFYNQNSNNTVSHLMQFGRIGYDYSISNRSTITLSQSFMKGGFSPDEEQTFNQKDSIENILYYGNRSTLGNNSWSNYSSQIQWVKTFPKKGKEFTTDFTYSLGGRGNKSDLSTYSYDALCVPNMPSQIQANSGSGNSNNFTYQFDFTNPITDTAKWEFGVKSDIRLEESRLDVTYKDNNTGVYNTDTALSNNYNISNMVNAAYVTYSNMLPLLNIGYMAGLRFEQTRFYGELVGKNSSVEYYYPDGTKDLLKAFFPSLYLTKRVGDKHEIQLNFARKINRPRFMQIMPFIMFIDKLNYRTGNPLLQPEFINSVETNYNRIFPSGNFFTSVYIKQTQGAITNFTQKLSTDTTGTVLINTFINGNTMYNMGWENNVKWSFLKRKLDVTLNLNLFYTDINATIGTTTLSNSGMSWNSKGMMSYKFPKSYTLQVNANYEAPRIIPQGTTVDQYSVDISLSKDIMRMFTFNLLVNDVFNTRRHGTIYESDAMIQTTSGRREARFVRLSLTWRFGEMDVSLFRKRNSKRSSEGGGGMDMEF